MQFESHAPTHPIPSLSSGLKANPFQRVISLVVYEKNIPEQVLLHQSRCHAEAARSRQLAMYLTHVVMSQSLTAIARVYGRDRTTVSHACALIEDMRDDPLFDAEVSRLEAILETGRAHHG